MIFQTFNPTQTQLRMINRTFVNNLSAVYSLSKNVNEKKLAAAIESVTKKASPFSQRFLKMNDSIQILEISDSTETLSIIDASSGSESGDEANIFGLIQSIISRQFRLDRGAPYSFSLIRGIENFYLVFAAHPALLDRFSLKNLFKYISMEYNGLKTPNELGLSQALLLEEEKQFIQSPKQEDSIRFWLQLAKETSFEWRPPRVENEVTDSAFSIQLSKQETMSLRSCAKELGLEISDLLRFCFHIFLYRLTKNETVVTAHHHRISTGPLGLIGFNENKPVLKSLMDPLTTARHYFKQEKMLWTQSQFYSDLPAQEMTRELKRVNPEFTRPTNVLFAEDTLPFHSLQLNDVFTHLLPIFSYHLENEDFGVFYDGTDQIQFHVIVKSPQQYSSVKLAFDHYLVLLNNIHSEIDQPISKIKIFNTSLNEKALDFSNGGKLTTKSVDIIEDFSQAVRKSPKSIAVRDSISKLSYSELEISAKKIAAQLLPHFKNSPEPLVGLCLSRSVKMIEGIFGVLFSGAAYLPLDSKMPSERLSYILNDAKMSLLIVDSDTREIIQPLVQCPVLVIEDLLLENDLSISYINAIQVSPSHPAYVIYTSGTTGKPKGVILERKALANFVAALDSICDRGPGTKWMQFASYNFDASVLEIFNPLAKGGELVIVPLEVRADPEALFSFMKEHGISHTLIPPALMPLLPRKPLPALKTLFTGGEVVDEETSRFWSKVVDFKNCYGPTEATVMCTHTRLGGYKSTLQLGRPLPGYKTYLLDDKGQLAPLGGVGEICIGGDSVARGYLGRPELTAQKFIENPFPDHTHEGKLYRTGDLARFLPNGELEFLGRNDFQVKIRGFRIELGDIETAITDQPEVRGAYVAVTGPETSKSLVAWYISQQLSPDQLRKRLSERLPHYMVPSYLIRLNSFPINVNGKIDRLRLPDPNTVTEVSHQKLDELELSIRKIWSELLKIDDEKIGLESHFFHLGGHSLLAALICTHINNKFELNVRPKLIFQYPVFMEFCEQIRTLPKEKTPFKALTQTSAKSAIVKNRLIELIYSRAAMNPDDNMYNIVMKMTFSKEINPIRFQKILSDFLNENLIFNTGFNEKENLIWGESQAHEPIKILLKEGTRSEIDSRIEELRHEALGIHQAPLWRAEIYAGHEETTLLFNVHHIIFDGWSLNLMIEEISERYEAASLGKTFTKNRLTWFDYCHWATDLEKSKPYTDAIQYWRNKLSNMNARVELPVKSHHKVPNSNRFQNIQFSADTVSLLKKFADENNITLPPVFMSLYLIWAWRISNQTEIVCGYPYAGRDIPGSENIFGTFVTMGYLRQSVLANQSFIKLVKSTHKQMIEDKEHLIAAPYDAEISGMDSLNLIFSLQSGIGLEGKIGSAQFKAEELPSVTSKGDLTGVFYQSLNGGVEGRIEYDSSIFDESTLSNLTQHFSQIVEAAAKNPKQQIRELTYQNQNDLSQFLKLSNGPDLTLKDEMSILDQFEEIVKTYPESIAIEYTNIKINYRDLDILSSKFASCIPTNEAFVGISLRKSVDLIAGIIGILKSGSAYVPLDPEYPAERLQYIARDIGLRTILVDPYSKEKLNKIHFENIKYILLKDLSSIDEVNQPKQLHHRSSPDSLAYVIHTSGSTGTPKGVMIEHRNVVKFIKSMSSSLDFNSNSIGSCLASTNFDASVFEIFMPLLNGGKLVLMSDEIRKNPKDLHASLKDHKITHSLIMPAVLQNMPQEPLPDMISLAYGGDTLDEKTAQYWSQANQLYTLYGPTEITVAATIGKIHPELKHSIIGHPLPGYKVYLLNKDLQPVPHGTIGEICIGGDMVATGYLNRKDLTLQKFVLDPFGISPYSRMYLSGDLGRYLPNGEIEFLGRNDNQIKLRGFRIELEEIESQISKYADDGIEIEEVHCAIKGEGSNRYLAAYYISKTEVNDLKIRTFLTQKLPEYMIPTFFVKVNSMPLTPSGKIDRNQLPAISNKKCEHPPHSGIERSIADIWEEILCLKGIGRDENFFHLGGNSLLVVRMLSEVRTQLNVDFSIGDFYSNPTIMAIAAKSSTSHIEHAIQDSKIHLNVPKVNLEPSNFKIETVLLTGASGFLGIFILSELLKKKKFVYCLVRCQDEKSGNELITKQAQAAGIKIDTSKIKVIPSDLEKKNIGLETNHIEKLCDDVDCIIHCGAFVHHLHSYSTLKSANVNSTIELLKIAVTKKIKPFTYISTQSVGSAIDGFQQIEEKILSNKPIIDSGYILSKWVGEQICTQASLDYELPMLIARPGNITGSTENGFTNYANNHFWLFNKGCIQLGTYPNVHTEIELTPVNLLAESIVAMSLNPQNQIRVRNLSNPLTLSIQDFYSELSKAGIQVRASNPKIWQNQLNTIDETHALSAIKEFYLGDLTQVKPTQVQRQETQDEIKKLKVHFNVDPKSLIKPYIEYLRKSGFLN